MEGDVTYGSGIGAGCTGPRGAGRPGMSQMVAITVCVAACQTKSLNL